MAGTGTVACHQGPRPLLHSPCPSPVQRRTAPALHQARLSGAGRPVPWSVCRSAQAHRPRHAPDLVEKAHLAASRALRVPPESTRRGGAGGGTCLVSIFVTPPASASGRHRFYDVHVAGVGRYCAYRACAGDAGRAHAGEYAGCASRSGEASWYVGQGQWPPLTCSAQEENRSEKGADRPAQHWRPPQGRCGRAYTVHGATYSHRSRPRPWPRRRSTLSRRLT